MLNATTEDMEPSYFIPVSFFGGEGGLIVIMVHA